MWSDICVKTISVPLTEAKAHLSRYGRLAQKGQATLVLKHNRSAFLIAPVPPSGTSRRKTPGLAKGRIHMAPDFDVTPPEWVSAFEGSP
jgi:antitoxin (DNA-binding transcriptional repressor) of toxin-antitoxin stability system